jgi:hypothetical protein
LSTNWVLKNCWKQPLKKHFDEKNTFNPVLTLFRHSFCSEETYPRPGTL